MNILVTGASGMIGRAVIPRLQHYGHKVLAFTGDITDAQNVLEQVEAADAVVHLAAILDETRPAHMRAVNVNGTQNILDACEKHRILHLVLVSSAGVHADSGETIDETTAIAPKTAYEKTKADAETLAHAHLETVPVTILRPALVLGPNEYWRGIVRIVQKDFPIIGDGTNGFAIVSLDDLADAIAFLTGNDAAIGETYLIAQNENPRLENVVAELRRQLGLTTPLRHMPVWQGKILAWASLAWSKISGKKTVLVPAHVDRLLKHRAYSIEKIKKLGWSPKDDTPRAIQKMLAGLDAKKNR